ncbi:1339_t:CDS:2, partial [Paraglomus brasilianum]
MTTNPITQSKITVPSNLTSTVQDLSTSLTAIKPNNSETTQIITYTLIATAIIMGIKDYLPDFKGALNNFYDERLKDLVENKSTEYKALAGEFIQRSLNYQKAMLAIG